VPDLPVVYLAAPLSAPTRAGIEANRRAAAEWACWIAKTFHVAVECSWLVMTSVLEETPENRALGLACDIALVKRCDCLIAVGPAWSSGMSAEAEHARAVLDWTGVSIATAAACLNWHAQLAGMVRGGMGAKWWPRA
jgi:hypothetical protein